VVKEHGSVSFNSKNGGGAPQEKLADGIQIGKMYIPFRTPISKIQHMADGCGSGLMEVRLATAANKVQK
jgi:hypothetical protein